LDLKNFRENSIQQISANRYIAFLTPGEFAKVASWKNINDINRIINSPGESAKGIVKYKSTDDWNPDQFGPLYIPSPREKIKINSANIGLFNCLIPDLLPDSTVTIIEKLYFLMGDNRSNAFDSRFIGLVPESSVIGCVDEEQ
jgi:signal peptidase I